jgi:hypothetical protein
MKISPNLRKRLVGEIRFVIGKMKEAPDYRKKAYYFSAIPAEMLRLFNIEFDERLLFAYMNLNNVYQIITGTADAIAMGKETAVVIFPEGFFEKLCEYLGVFTAEIEEDKDTCDMIEAITCLAYSATGNGFYLHQKGILKI